MIHLLGFWSSSLAQELTNFMGGPIQTAEGVGGLSILTMAYRKLNCHQHKCWRIGKHEVAGTPFITCAKHHPGGIPDQITAEHLADAHANANSEPATL